MIKGFNMYLKLITLVVFSLLAGSSLNADKKALKISPDNIVKWKNVPERNRPLELHYFYPDNFKNTSSYPTILLFFGGGWSGYNPTQFYPQAKYFASRGMLAICATYRTTSYYKTEPWQCVQDAKSTVRYLKSNAKKLGVDPNKLVVGGGSAGGHIAAATASLKDWNNKEDDLNISSTPNALILFNPVFDNGPGGYANNKKDTRVKDYWETFSPLHNLDGTQPPTLVLLGDRDKHLSAEKAQLYGTKMKQNGDKCEVIIYPGQKHGFFNIHKGGKEYFIKTLITADKFLLDNKFLKGEEKVKQWFQNTIENESLQ